jgi:hypothetical protein
MSDADARVERKAKRKERKAERKRKKEEKKKARVDKKEAAAEEDGRVHPPPDLRRLARCDDDALEPYLRRHYSEAPGMTLERLRMVRDVAREVVAASADDDEPARQRLAEVQAALTGAPPSTRPE